MRSLPRSQILMKRLTALRMKSSESGSKKEEKKSGGRLMGKTITMIRPTKLQMMRKSTK
jgi:hypothetical protein